MVTAQYNPSTGLASYNPATGKSQVAVELLCNTCSTIPTLAQIQVTLQDVVINDGCFDAFSRDVDWTDVPDINGTHILDRVVGNFCQWRKQVTGHTTTRERYNSTNGTCGSGLFDTVEYTDLFLTLNFVFVSPGVYEAGLAVSIQDVTSPGFSVANMFRSDYTPTSKCLEATGIASTTGTDATSNAANSGTADIVELP